MNLCRVSVQILNRSDFKNLLRCEIVATELISQLYGADKNFIELGGVTVI